MTQEGSEYCRNHEFVVVVVDVVVVVVVEIVNTKSYKSNETKILPLWLTLAKTCKMTKMSLT